MAILGNADIIGEELMTVFTGAEALIDSRPLTCQSANPEGDTKSFVSQPNRRPVSSKSDKTDSLQFKETLKICLRID